jgi:hypothetical protein
MKLSVPYFNDDTIHNLDDLWDVLSKATRHPLNNNSWPMFSTSCKACFGIIHSSKHVVIKFFVTGDHFSSFKRPVNSDVHLDNCVEFFISLNQSEYYYNFEFNALGVGKIAYGQKAGRRIFLDNALIGEVTTKIESSNVHGQFNWAILLKIPIEIFIFNDHKSFDGLTAYANFYKCADALPNPHYLTWNTIISPKPDFHRPESFGLIQFDAINVQLTQEIEK